MALSGHTETICYLSAFGSRANTPLTAATPRNSSYRSCTDAINNLPAVIEFKRYLGQAVEVAVWVRA
jgi:hypothetical protein